MFEHDQVRPAYPGESKRARVEAMFDRIAPRYDRLNRVISLGIDASWRRTLLRHVMELTPRRVLDVATGTGDLALSFAAAGVPDVVGVDISQEMLAVAETKAARAHVPVRYTRADAEALPYNDGTFDAVTIAFGVRNFEHLARGVAELVRVVRPGGLLAVLELSTPTAPVLRAIHGAYTRHVLPHVGAALSGERAAYEYLPASVAAFPSAERFRQVVEDAGCAASSVPLTLGVAHLSLATVLPR